MESVGTDMKLGKWVKTAGLAQSVVFWRGPCFRFIVGAKARFGRVSTTSPRTFFAVMSFQKVVRTGGLTQTAVALVFLS